MAVKTYHGTCSTASGVAIKEVHIRDLDLAEEGFEFGDGDILSVYFVHTNTASTPSLKIYIDDTEQERSISEDSGKSIKTLGVSTTGIIGAWDEGETVIFVYTRESNTNNYYWELVNGAPSTEKVYGVTKLFGNASLTQTAFKNWLNGISPSTSDYNTALTPGLLKKFYDVLSNDSSSMITLAWEQSGQGQNLTTLGVLKINNDSNNTVTIKYPLESFVRDLINANLLSTQDLKNWGPDPNKDNKTGIGQFYLTNVLQPADSTRILYFKNGSRNQAFLDPNTSSGNLHLRGQNGITLNASNSSGGIADIGVGTVYCRPVLRAQSDLIVDGKINAKGITCTGLTVNGSGSVSSNFEAKGNLKGKTLYEEGETLKKRYSGKWMIKDYDSGKITIQKNSTCGHKYMSVTQKGWKAIGIISFNLDYAGSNTGDAIHCYLWENWLLYNDQKIMYSIRNTKNAAVTIRAYFRVLYFREL